ncbi:MAG TPA: hypothetical protein VGP68_17875 [Gemmataceae bacterium]|nr:hypothetical protein [Gemmataceae bacterium]
MPARTDRSSGHARSVLLWGVGVYAIAQLSVSLMLDYGWPLLRFPSASVRLQQLAESKIQPDIVLLGSSRVEAGIIPTEIVWQLERECRPEHPIGVFKSGLGCGDAIVSEFIFSRIRDRGVRPSLLVLEVSPETLNRNNEWLGMHVRRQLRWDDAPRYFLDICRSMQVMRWLGERINPVYIHREELWGRTAEAVDLALGQPGDPVPAWSVASSRPGSAGMIETASLDDPLLPAAPPLSAEAAAISRYGTGQQLRWLRNYRIRGSATSGALERVLRECREEGIEVVLLGIPVTAPHRTAYTPEIDREFFAYVQKLTQDYGCRFVNYRDRIPDSLFSDNHHLSPVGGVYFSRLLTFELLGPFCQSHKFGQDARTARAH